MASAAPLSPAYGDVAPFPGDAGEILFLCHRLPFPPDRGDKIRSFHLLKALAEIAPVHVGTFADDARDLSFAGDLARVAASQHVARRASGRAGAGLRGLVRRQPMLVSLYDDKGLHRWVAERLASRPIRAIVAYSVQMAHFVPVSLPPHVRFLMDFVDFDSAKYAAYGRDQGGVMGWVNRREGRMLFDFEKQVAARASASAFVSGAEAAMFAQAAGLPVGAIGHFDNGVDHGYFSPDADFSPVDHGEGPLLVFTGQMDYRPNIEAVESFARETLPLIRARRREARFAIVGRNPSPPVVALASLPGVIVTGGVPDVRGWLASADVVVAPLRIARGVQNKVLEAMAMARPVVASAQAAEGIDAAHGTELLVADGPQAEADAVCALLDDPARRTMLGSSARARVLARYDWAATLSRLRDLVGMKAQA